MFGFSFAKASEPKDMIQHVQSIFNMKRVETRKKMIIISSE